MGMRALAPLLLAFCGCQALFPIVIDGGEGTSDAGKTKDGSKDAPDFDAPGPIDAGDAAAPPSDAGGGSEAGVWCGGGTPCPGTCCVSTNNGYSFACKAKGDPCTGAVFAFSCDDPAQCPASDPICCYHEYGAPEAGTYHVTSGCASSCSAFDWMCGGPSSNGCPFAQNCGQWFSGYYVCR